MKSDVTTVQDPPTAVRTAGEASAPVLNYARSSRGGHLRRWLRPGSPAFLVLILALAAGGTWEGWKWRLSADEESFNERATIGRDVRGPYITFSKPPTAGSLRHLARLPGTCTVWIRAVGDSDSPRALRGLRLSNIVGIGFGSDVDVDPWLKELSRPDCRLDQLALLGLAYTTVTDDGLRELSRPEAGPKSLTTVTLYGTKVTRAGIDALRKARPRLTGGIDL
jgi:hypothetical protein